MTRTPLTRAPALVPTGTARALFLGPDPRDSDEPLSSELRQRLQARDVSDETWLAAWEVTRWAAGSSPLDRRALGCLVIALLEAIESGSTCLPVVAAASAPGVRAGLPGEIDVLPSLLARLGLDETERQAIHLLVARIASGTAPPAIAALFGPPGARRPFILSDGALYSEHLWSVEDRLATRLRARAATTITPLPGAIGDALATVATTAGATRLATEQIAAVRAALTCPLTIIAGGPGTGKTSVIVALLRTLARLGIPAGEIAVGAPTGRAAQRIEESVHAALARLAPSAPEDIHLGATFAGAVTLHRLLGIKAARVKALDFDGPEHYDAWPLPHKIVVIDEASMIDLVLMEQLVAAVAPDARLILLGDADQLPSVEVGAIFRDLVAGATQATVRLTQSHRMRAEDPAGADILRMATALNDGDPAVAATVPLRVQAAELRFAGFERLTAAALGAFLDRWHGEILGGDTHLADALDRRYELDDANRIADTDGRDVARVAGLLGSHAAARILCVTRTAGRVASAEAINRALHARLTTAALGRGAGDWLATSPFSPGEPVLVQRNDYSRGLTNGDLGVVLRIRSSRGDHLGVAFGRQEGVVVHRLDDIHDDIGLAFAMTVHKAQGSEYDRVALVLPETDVAPLSREILYTAITRARHAVVVVGDPELFALGAGRTLERFSGLVRGLRRS